MVELEQNCFSGVRSWLPVTAGDWAFRLARGTSPCRWPQHPRCSPSASSGYVECLRRSATIRPNSKGNQDRIAAILSQRRCVVGAKESAVVCWDAGGSRVGEPVVTAENRPSGHHLQAHAQVRYKLRRVWPASSSKPLLGHAKAWSTKLSSALPKHRLGHD